MSDLSAITGARIFDGHHWHDDAALLVERHSYGMAAGYVVGSVAASVSALFFGLAIFRSAGHLP